MCLFVFVSCSDETVIYQDTLTDGVQQETDALKLQNSISFSKAGVLDLYEENNSVAGTTGKNTQNNAGDYPLVLVAQVQAPIDRNGMQLTASHVVLNGDHAYVSYNVAEAPYSGAIEIINIADPHLPSVSARIFYNNADLNSLQYDNGYLYVAGGVDAEASQSATANSFLARIPVNGGRFGDLGSIVYVFQQGFNANDVRIKDNLVLVTSGQDGALAAYDKNNMMLQNELPFMDLRSIAVSDQNYAVLDASSGVTLLDNSFNTLREIPIDTDFGVATKKTIELDGERLLVSEGGKGAGVYNINNGIREDYIPILIDPQGVAVSDKVTNAVATNAGILFMANGGAGLSLTELGSQAHQTVGVVQLEGSINYVASKGDYLFAASGKEGLQIVMLNRAGASLVERCKSLPKYSGSAKLYVRQGETMAYQGSKRFNLIENEGELLLCGNWTVRNDVKILEGGLFEMNGTLVIGRNNRQKDLVVEKNAILRIEGNLSVYGNLILKEGAKLEFLGPSNEVNIFGKVDAKESATVTGTFRDVRNKF